jgi:hypothetical protein
MKVIRAALVLAFVFAMAGLASANCAKDDPTGAKTLAARQQVATDCMCDQTDPPSVTHGQYVSCAAGVANARSSLDPSDPNFLPKTCKGAVKKCAAHSVCGKPGFVTCCLTNSTTGATSCKIKSLDTKCTDKGGTVGTCTSCCDACPAPGAGPSCPAT